LDKAAAWLRQSLAYSFDDPQLLRQALTHRSAAGGNNERLEFLGDAVLQLVISDWVYARAGDASEGQLSRIRASLVKSRTLSKLANALGVGVYVILGPGEKKSGGHRRASILADTLEAVFGAIYLDGGLAAARAAIQQAYGELLHDMPEFADLRDPKSRLQELLQGRGMAVPDYEVLQVSGKAHAQTFEVMCSVPALGATTTGSGPARKDAEQKAAVAMLATLERADG